MNDTIEGIHSNILWYKMSVLVDLFFLIDFLHEAALNIPVPRIVRCTL